MRFMMALIYAMAAVLLAGLLGAYFYFSVDEEGSPAAANFALLLFVNAVLVFALMLIWLENLPEGKDAGKNQRNENKTPDAGTVKSAEEIRAEKELAAARRKQAEEAFVSKIAENFTGRLTPLAEKLEQIEKSQSLTNKTLNMGLERLNTRIDDIENTAVDSRAENAPQPQIKQISQAAKFSPQAASFKMPAEDDSVPQIEELMPKTADEAKQEADLDKIFNDELADTLSGLEIMKDK